ncbi:MAG: aconitate hydratase AcnA, partial [Alphaproteobacteria bacterium]
MSVIGQDSLKVRRTLDVGGKAYSYFSLAAAEEAGLGDVSRLPFSLKVLLENLLRFEDGRTVTTDDVAALAGWTANKASREIAYRPARVLMQDFTGVPAVVDLAAMRDAIVALGGDPARINPLSAVDLVIDHSVMVDRFGSADAFAKNVELEYGRNGERYSFLRWGQQAFDNFRVVPPGTGICHQVNLEYLARGVWTAEADGETIAFPDTLVGTDSHTTMVNGLAVLGWGVGGIEAEAAMLGQPISMLIPDVVGFELTGALKEGTTTTDLVLAVTQMLRAHGVVGKFVEFHGAGLDHLSLADRATLANMAPEYGATCGFFPVDAETIRFLEFTGRPAETVALVEAYAKAQGMWRDAGAPAPAFSDTIGLDIATVEPSIAGPKRPQDRVLLSAAAGAFETSLAEIRGVHAGGAASDMAEEGGGSVPEPDRSIPVEGADYSLSDGDVVIAAITSCTNTSNPSVMIAAGLVAKKAVALGLKVKPWVKTSLAPGSQVVTDYLAAAGLQAPLDALGFNLVGYGCTTCIGNSGPLPAPIARAIEVGDLVACSVLSGNRNFEGRVSPHAKANYLASPPLVVAYAIAGSLKVDVTNDALGTDSEGREVTLSDIWPSNAEVRAAVEASLTPEMFRRRYGHVFEGDAAWRGVAAPTGMTYAWDDASTYVRRPSFFEDMAPNPAAPADILGARPLAILGDSVTTDHISPAGAIKADGPAGAYLTDHGVAPGDFNSFGARRGNHEVMMRGTFANIRLRNEMAPGTEGGITRLMPEGAEMAIYDAATAYMADGVPLVVVGGKEYGTGSSRDWAAKGTRLLGVKAVIVESFERIHRSNLVGMGVLPLQFKEGDDRNSLGLDGGETFDITGIAAGIEPRMDIACKITRADGSVAEIALTCRIDTAEEV